MSLAIAEKSHHLFGGSSTKYWSRCFGWASKVKLLPPEPAGAAAEKGTALHTGILERKTQREIDFRRYGTPVGDIDYSDIPNWPEDGHVLAEEFWQSIWKEVLEEIITGKVTYIEKKLMYSEELDAGGTADLIAIYTNDKAQVVAWVVDLKTGNIRVEPSEDQLEFYLATLYKLYKAKGLEIDVFYAGIYQPSHSEPFTKHQFTKAKIIAAIKKYDKAIDESLKENPKFKTGDHCKWCSVRGNCPALAKKLDDEFTAVARRENGLVSLPNPEGLDDKILYNLYMHGDLLKAFMSGVKKEIIRRFVIKQPVEGLKIVEGVAKRKWKDEKSAIEILRTYGIDPVKPKCVGLGDAVKLLVKKDYVKKDAEKLIAPLLEKPPGKPLVVTSDDPRESIVLEGGASLLEEFEESEGISED